MSAEQTTPRYPIVCLELPTAEAEMAASELWETGATGIEERDDKTLEPAPTGTVQLIAHFEAEADATEAVARLEGRYAVRLDYVDGDDWKERWKAFFHVTRVGERLVIRPSWESFEPSPGDVVLTLDPGQAFGTGTHETTRLVLAEVERIVKGGERVLDVGCGSGVLGIAAQRLGAGALVAVDVDPIAVRTTEENAAENDAHVHASTRPVQEVEGRFEIVLANIRTPVLVSMAEALIERTAQTLVLSGILQTEEQEVRAAFEALPLLRAPRDGEWVALVYERPADA